MVLNEQLQTFVLVSEAGSFNKAAERLYISAPAVIKQMNALERDLGFRVFVRTHQGVTLTPSGRLLRDEAKLLLSHFQETVAAARRASAPPSKELRIGTSIFKPFQPFIELWNQYASEFPGYSLKIVPFEDDHNTISSTVQSLGSRFDFLVAACNSKTWLRQVSFYKLWDDPFCAAIPRQHPLAQKELLTLEDLQGETIYLFTKGDADSIDAVWEKFAEYPDIHVEATSFYDMDLFNQAARQNRLILSIQSWSQVHPSFVSRPIDWDLTTPYGLLYAKKAPESVQKFIQCLQKGAANK